MVSWRQREPNHWYALVELVLDDRLKYMENTHSCDGSIEKKSYPKKVILTNDPKESQKKSKKVITK